MLHAILASFWLPVQASENAPNYDKLFYFVMFINIFFSSLIMAILIYFVLKYRHREGKPHDPTAGHSTALELTWTIIPTMLVLVIFYFGFRDYLHANTVPPYADQVTANGAMWKWTFTYPTGLTDEELHLVVNRPTEMILQSADVLHDLDIPAFRMKKDVVPGRYNKEWFQPNLVNARPKAELSWQTNASMPASKTSEAGGYYKLFSGDSVIQGTTTELLSGETFGFETADGSPSAVYTHNGKKIVVPLDVAEHPEFTWKIVDNYQVYCAMYCGTGHSIMLAKCIVETQADFDKWMADKLVWEPQMAYVARGKELASSMGCAQCHSIDGSKMTGPSWKDLYGSTVDLVGGGKVLADDAYIAESIVLPSKKIVLGFEDKMPQDFGAKLKPNDITALTWYMKLLSGDYKGSMEEGMKVGAAMKGMKGSLAPTTAPAAAPNNSPTFEPPAVDGAPAK